MKTNWKRNIYREKKAYLVSSGECFFMQSDLDEMNTSALETIADGFVERVN